MPHQTPRHHTQSTRPARNGSSSSSSPLLQPVCLQSSSFLASTNLTRPQVSGFAGNIYFPALPTIATDLATPIELITLTVTSYLVFQGLAPSLWGPISDTLGRRPAYLGTLALFVAACAALARIDSYPALLVLRCVQSAGSASTIAIGAGVIGDVAPRAERGSAMAVFQAGLLVPIGFGPVIGGALAGALGWHAIFVFLAAYGGAVLLMIGLALPETLRSVVADGSVVPARWIARVPLCLYQDHSPGFQAKSLSAPALPARKRVDFLSLFRVLCSKFAAPMIVFLAIYYSVWQMSITAMSTLFERNYHLGEVQIGLTFIANGVGSVLGTLTTGRILDADYARIKARLKRAGNETSDGEASEEEFPIERARFRLVPLFSVLQCASILMFGWSIQFPAHVHIAVPIVSTFITGWTAISTVSMVTTYLVDIFPESSAAASASLNLARCLCAAGGTSFIVPMIDAIGVGPAFSVCAGVQFLAAGLPLIQWKFAGPWRMKQRGKESE